MSFPRLAGMGEGPARIGAGNSGPWRRAFRVSGHDFQRGSLPAPVISELRPPIRAGGQRAVSRARARFRRAPGPVGCPRRLALQRRGVSCRARGRAGGAALGLTGTAAASQRQEPCTRRLVRGRRARPGSLEPRRHSRAGGGGGPGREGRGESEAGKAGERASEQGLAVFSVSPPPRAPLFTSAVVAFPASAAARFFDASPQAGPMRRLPPAGPWTPATSSPAARRATSAECGEARPGGCCGRGTPGRRRLSGLRWLWGRRGVAGGGVSLVQNS